MGASPAMMAGILLIWTMESQASWQDLIDSFSLQSAEDSVTHELDLYVSDPAQFDIPEYDRDFHFGRWRNIEGCLDTRAIILIRDDNDGKVQFTRDGCRVKSGHWEDPYSDQTMKKAHNTHVDHVVALKDAYDSGAWRWSSEKRCHFANYMADDFHLLAVSAFENRRKGDSGPDEYLPADEGFHCQFIRKWAFIKKTWGLSLTPQQRDFIDEKWKQLRCSKSLLSWDSSEILKWRQNTRRIPEYCQSP